MARNTSDQTVPDTPAAAKRPEPLAGLPERYKLLDVIGEGGMGRVYRARDATLGRDVAIKVLESEVKGTDATKQRERFVREARAAARLAHPNIVTVHDVDPDAGWLVMDLVEGQSLKDLGRVPPRTARSIAEQVLSALDAAHAAGVIHRDIKPSNIMVDDTGKVTLVDFGVARLVDAELTNTGESLGTPAYMAPEQIRGATVDERTDLYGLGATLYELVSGERMVAFESPSQSVIDQLARYCPGDPALVELIRRSLQADPSARPPSARDALAILARGTPRKRRSWLVAVPIVAAGAAFGVLSLRKSKEIDPRRDEAIRLVQRGEPQKASVVLDAYLVDHPDDSEAQTMKLLASWWKEGVFDDAGWTAIDGKLEPEQRAMLRGISLIARHREGDAIAFLDDRARNSPGSVAVEYALGEAYWHDGKLERGADTLAHAFALDPHWRIALEHVTELRLSRGDTAALHPIADQLRTVDSAAAAGLDCRIAISDRRYRDAADGAARALEHEEPIPELYTCLAEALILAGDLDAADTAAKRGLDKLPTDLREWGEQSLASELLLYRGRFDDYVERLPGVRGSRQAQIALALWRPGPEDPPATVPTTAMLPAPGVMRAPPIGTAIDILQHHVHGRDPLLLYKDDPQPEVRGFGYGLGAELRGDTQAAIAEYKKALAVPAKGDMRMLLAHALARVLAPTDPAGAAAACEDVLTPRVYQSYRAVVLPDCVLWSGDRARWAKFLGNWRGGFAHPAVVEMRKRLDAAAALPQSPP